VVAKARRAIKEAIFAQHQATVAKDMFQLQRKIFRSDLEQIRNASS